MVDYKNSKQKETRQGEVREGKSQNHRNRFIFSGQLSQESMVAHGNVPVRLPTAKPKVPTCTCIFISIYIFLQQTVPLLFFVYVIFKWLLRVELGISFPSFISVFCLKLRRLD